MRCSIFFSLIRCLKATLTRDSHNFGGINMKVNTPLGVIEFPDALKNYGYASVDTNKPLKRLKPQSYEGGREVLWYRNAFNQAITEISCIKDKPQDYQYQCSCGYELKSGFNLESIRCHRCEELMTKTYIGVVAKVV